MSLLRHLFDAVGPIFVAKFIINKSTQERQAVDALALEAEEGRA